MHNKIDMKSLSEEEKKNLSKYGQFPSRPIARQSRLKERKYFDSGDYALSKAGNKEVQNVGHDHPSPNSIPHYVSAPPPAAPVVGVGESAGESTEAAEAASPSSLQTLAGGSPGVAIVNTDSPTSTMVNPSCLATETSAASAIQPTAAAAASTAASAASASAGEDAAAAFRMPFGAPAATSLPSDAASAAPASASGSTPPARPAFTRRVSQVAGTQYRVKD
ncbi:hypothetical protein GGH99_000046 [Coemansia sp. RSA 1285]|nr:hypothetical protein GGH99_000046 [Coemansia sp. RSA 1285]